MSKLKSSQVDHNGMPMSVAIENVVIAAANAEYTHPATHPVSMITGAMSQTQIENLVANSSYTHPATHPVSMITGAMNQTQVEDLISSNSYTHPTTHPVSMVEGALSETEIESRLADNRDYADSKIALLVNSAPETLDTIAEIATALGSDPNFATTITTSLGTKVTKVDGKALSTNDYTNEDKSKLAGVEINANLYVHPADHPATFITEDATHRFMTDAERDKLNAVEVEANKYIHPANHPASVITQDTNNRFVTDAQISKLAGIEANANLYVHPDNHAPSIITQDANNRFVTDAEKSTWNGKASTTVATTSVNGLMSSTDKTKLDGVATNANLYVHPANHAPSIITQDASNRFVTDTEKSTWNGKASGVHTHAIADTTGLQTALNGKESLTNKGIANGYAELDSNGLVPASQLPSYVDDVLEYANAAALPVTGTTGKIYITLDNNLTFRWSGSAYAEISASIALGETSATAYRGDRGKIAYDHSQVSHAPSNAQKNSDITKAEIEAKLIGELSSHTHTISSTAGLQSALDSKAPTTAVTTTVNGIMLYTDKVKLDGIATNANNYVHPANHAPSIITQDANNRFVTDTEKSTWNGKASTSVATTTVNGLMSSTDKSKLDGVAASANNYTHPATHLPSIIAQDTSNRFVTDTEKSTWNGKASTSVATTSVNGLMSSTDKTKLDGVAANANNYTHPAAHDVSMITNALSATEINALIQTATNNLISSAPGTLDTLNELAAALGDDPNFSATITASLNNKVDKIAGKALSTNDFTTTYKDKLDSISANANEYTHPATHPVTMITGAASTTYVDTAVATRAQMKVINSTFASSTSTLVINDAFVVEATCKVDVQAEGAKLGTWSCTYVDGVITISSDIVETTAVPVRVYVTKS